MLFLACDWPDVLGIQLAVLGCYKELQCTGVGPSAGRRLPQVVGFKKTQKVEECESLDRVCNGTYRWCLNDVHLLHVQ